MSSPFSDGASSPPALDQSRRDGRLDTPLGPNVLVLKRLHAGEGISELFEYRVDALSPERNIDFDKLLGKGCCVSIKTFNDKTRCFHGIVTEAQWAGMEGHLYAYRLVLRPWTWMLGRRATCRIFKDKNALEIIKLIFSDAGFNDFEIKVNESELEKKEYCVQYRETDLAFISRLMEEEGLYYFFTHTADKHKLVLANQRSSHVKTSPGTPPVTASGPIAPAGTFPFKPRDHRSGRDVEHLADWTSERRFRTGKVKLNDFDYMKPKGDLVNDQETSEKYQPHHEAYDYPGRFVKPDVGKRLAKIRLESEQAADRRMYASGQAPSLAPGALFAFSEHPTDAGEYLVIQTTHTFAQQVYETGQAPGNEEPCQGHYVVMKHDRQFRAAFATPRPVVRGPQTAFVTDEGDKKSKWIDVDEEGRILVQFHWNRDDRSKELTSRRVRVAQMWSGKDWGWQVIPRVGQEVVVDFLEGDPDQPLVVGTVYNKDYRYPYPLPANATISGVKTETEEGTPGYNELIFEDKKGAENIRMHAQRLHELTIREKETRTIGVANKSSEVARDTAIENGHDNLVLKHGDRATLLKMGDDSLKLEMGDQNVKLDTGNSSTDIALEYKLKAGMRILLECGSSSIEMTPVGIKIKSTMIQVDGVMTDVKGSAMLTLKGGLTMIN